jgi:hypothetical protein
MKHYTSLILIAFTLFYSSLSAQNKLIVDLGMASNYMVHGRTLSNHLSCFQPGIYYAIDKGPTIMAWFSLPYDRLASPYDEWNIIVDHGILLREEGTTLNFKLHGYANYWYNPESGLEVQSYYHGMKYNIGLKAPVTLHQEKKAQLTAGYDYNYYHAIGRQLISAGGIHEFSMAFDGTLSKRISITTKTIINNHQGAIDPAIVRGWSHLSQHLQFSIHHKLAVIRPSFHYQWTLEPTVNNKQQFFWAGLNLVKSFSL